MTQPPDGKWNKLDWIQGTGPVPETPSSDSHSRTPYCRHFPYRPRVVPMLLGAAFFGVCGLFMSNQAITNDRGLVVNGIIHFGVTGASMFYWCIAAISFGFVAIVVLFALPQIFMHREIVIDDSSITVPGWGFSTRRYRIEFRDVHRVSVSTYQRQAATYTTLKIHHIGGANSINSRMLPNDSDTDSILAILQREMVSQKEPAIACTKCGYSLRGNASGICPECGIKVPQSLTSGVNN